MTDLNHETSPASTCPACRERERDTTGTVAALRRERINKELLEALDYLLEQRVDMRVNEGIELSEGEDDARSKALDVIDRAHGEAA